MTSRQSRNVFITTFLLQNSDFAKDVAKCCSSDPATQAAIAGSINAVLGMASTVAGYQFVSSFGVFEDISISKNLLRLTDAMQVVDSLGKITGDVGMAVYSFREAGYVNEMGQYQAAIASNKEFLSLGDSQMQKNQDFFSSIMKETNSNITTIANIIPEASKAEADALENSKAGLN